MLKRKKIPDPFGLLARIGVLVFQILNNPRSWIEFLCLIGVSLFLTSFGFFMYLLIIRGLKLQEWPKWKSFPPRFFEYIFLGQDCAISSWQQRISGVIFFFFFFKVLFIGLLVDLFTQKLEKRFMNDLRRI